MIELEYEMTYAENIDGPLGPTAGSPLGERVCWQVVSATLRGPRINASLAMPGMDWMRLGIDGVRRPDLRAQLTTDDGELILFRYDVAVIRIAPCFEVGTGRYAWLGESVFVGRGRLTGRRAIEYEIYRVL